MRFKKYLGMNFFAVECNSPLYFTICVCFTGTKKKAILTLGAMAMSLKTVAPQRSQDVVEYLHQYLNSITPSDHDAAVIDGIGNAGHKGSQSILHHYAKNDKRSNVQHAAIRALRHHHDTDVRERERDSCNREKGVGERHRDKRGEEK